MRKAVIVLGDKTTHGGTVIQASLLATVNGKPIALRGDLVSCPQCKGVFPIVEGSSLGLFQGELVAVDTMKTACGASLIASQDLMWIEDGGQQERSLDTLNNSSHYMQKNKYQIRFHMTNDDGVPYANTKFTILFSDAELEGMTDENGFTPVFYSDKESEAEIKLHFGEDNNNNQ